MTHKRDSRCSSKKSGDKTASVLVTRSVYTQSIIKQLKDLKIFNS